MASRSATLAWLLALVALGSWAEARIEPDCWRQLAGQVVDEATGAPIAGATIEADGVIEHDGARTGVVDGQADRQGEFALRVRAGDRSIRVRAAAYATAIMAVPAAAEEIEVALARGSTVAGELVLPDGVPATGRVGIAVSRPDPWEPLGFWGVDELLSGGRKANVGADGRFRFDNVPAGSYRLWATSPHGAVDEQLIVVLQHEPTDVLHLAVHPHAAVAGTVSGLAESETVYLSVRQPDGETVSYRHDVANGPFQIAGIPNGRYMIVARSTEGRTVEVPFEIDDLEAAEVDLAFRWTSKLRGQVLVRGAPVAPFRMQIVATPLDDSKPVRTVWIGLDGSYAIPGLADAAYVVTARGHRFEVDVSGDTEFDLALQPNSLSGTVWAEGERWPGHHVVARTVDDGREEPVVAYADAGQNAEFRFDGLPAGEYTVAVKDPFWAGAIRSVTVDGAIDNFDFWLERTDDLQPVRVLRLGEPATGELKVDIEHGVFGHIITEVPLDERGVALLPTALAGAKLRLSKDGHSAEISDWNAAATEVELSPTP